MEKVFIEGDLEFDFTNTISAEKFDDITYGGGMKQVDFIIETEDRYYFIEVKNPDNARATPKAKKDFLDKIKENNLKEDLIKKYKDSVIINWANDKYMDKPIYYVTILEASYIDDAIKLSLMDIVGKGLPLKLNTGITLKRDIIKGFGIMSMTEWNKRFVKYPIRKI